MQNRALLIENLSNFKVGDAQCAVESDRDLVTCTLVEWFGTLDKFDEHVRTTIKSKVLATIGDELHFPLKYQLPTLLVLLFLELDYISCGYYSVEHAGSELAAQVNALCTGRLIAIWRIL